MCLYGCEPNDTQRKKVYIDSADPIAYNVYLQVQSVLMDLTRDEG